MLETIDGEPERLDLVVRAMRWEAQDVLGLRLERADRGELPAWSPGAHVDLRFENGVERQYSLCSSPDDRRGWEVAVLQETVSRGGSRYVHRELRPGHRVSAGRPRNTFDLEAAEETVFVAGGIGITALMPMIRTVEAEGRPWRLAYLGRSRDRMAFLDEPVLADGAVTLVPADRSQRLDLAEWIGPVGGGVRVYACGPQRMLDELEGLATAWPKRALRVERFQPKSFADLGDGEAFEVEARRSGLRVTVDAGCSILEMLERAGIPVPSSCLEGVCGTCETAIVDGEAEHRDSILSADEQEANETMMICVSRSKTPSLVLDL